VAKVARRSEPGITSARTLRGSEDGSPSGGGEVGSARVSEAMGDRRAAHPAERGESGDPEGEECVPPRRGEPRRVRGRANGVSTGKALAVEIQAEAAGSP